MQILSERKKNKANEQQEKVQVKKENLKMWKIFAKATIKGKLTEFVDILKIKRETKD